MYLDDKSRRGRRQLRAIKPNLTNMEQTLGKEN